MVESTSNVEFAHKVIEHAHHRPTSGESRTKWVEIAEAIVLAIVATSTAWSGYQAAKWDALSAQNYNLASRTTVLSKKKRRWLARTAFTTSRRLMAGFSLRRAAITSSPHTSSADFGLNTRQHSQPGRRLIPLTTFQHPSVRFSCLSTQTQTASSLQTSLRRQK